MLRAVAVVNVIATALGFVVVLGSHDLPVAGTAVLLAAVGLLASALISSPEGAVGRLAFASVGAVLPVAAGLGAVAAGRAATADATEVGVSTAAVGLVCGVVGAALGTAARQVVDARKPHASGGGITSALVAVGVSAALVVAVPATSDHVVERRLVNRINHCDDMAPFGPPSPRALQRTLAAACAVRQRAERVVVKNSTPVAVAVYGNGAASKAAASDAESAAAYYYRLLGPPAIEEVAVLSIDIPGPVRGMAGPGYVLIDSGELVDPSECASFRSSAGVRGRCGRWVVAHEMAHQWFRWTAFDRGTVANAALVEGTADYLAYRWWRETVGGADAATLAQELFGGRIALARPFAEDHAPVVTPEGMSDGEERALVYGRATAAWLAVEVAVGPDRTAEALRTVFTVGRESPHFNEVLEAVQQQDTRAAEVLREWWTLTPLELLDSEWMPQPENSE